MECLLSEPLMTRLLQKTAKNKQNARKPKECKPEDSEGKKKKRKKMNKEVRRKTSLAPSLTQVEEDEEEGRSSPEEGENKQEEIQIDSPTLPEIPKIPGTSFPQKRSTSFSQK